jgi:hypothetical protein
MNNVSWRAFYRVLGFELCGSFSTLKIRKSQTSSKLSIQLPERLKLRE